MRSNNEYATCSQPESGLVRDLLSFVRDAPARRAQVLARTTRGIAGAEDGGGGDH